MKKQPWKVYLFWIILSQAVGGLSGWLTRDSMQVYAQEIKKPFLSPPGIVFPIVWAVLFLLMGIGAARIYLCEAAQNRSRVLLLFCVQLVFNFFWSIIFFNMQQFGFALIWLLILWGLILWMIVAFRKIDGVAAWLQIPYLLWVAFAAYLNFGVWRLN